METRIRLLLLSIAVAACSGCASMHWPWHHPKSDAASASAITDDVDAAPPSVIEPQVERRKIKVPKIRAKNVELGAYYGIHDSGSLVAMAGERLHLTGFTEVSAVCTHPNFRGRGYGNGLMSTVISGILNRGETPFLHVKTDNPALALYKKLGFQIRAQLYLAVIQQTVLQETK